MQPNEYEITFLEDNEGGKAMAKNPLSSGRTKYIDVRWHWDPLSSGRSKHIDLRWHFVRELELVGKEELKVMHVASEWQHADIRTKALHVTPFKRHRKAMLNLPAEE